MADDDWIPHDGGPKPVEWGTWGQLRYRNGKETKPMYLDGFPWRWKRNRYPTDIVAYRELPR